MLWIRINETYIQNIIHYNYMNETYTCTCIYNCKIKLNCTKEEIKHKGGKMIQHRYKTIDGIMIQLKTI